MKFNIIATAFVLFSLIGLAGCHTEGEAAKTHSLTPAEQIKVINDNPKISAQTKAIMIQQIQQQAGSHPAPNSAAGKPAGPN